MALIRANRESIDDRFNVLGFTIRTENPLFEIGLATDPDLLKVENRARRNAGNFFSSSVLGADARRGQAARGESIYLVPPSVVSRFVGQPRLYFGLATYLEGNRSQPASVKTPDRGNMYVSLSGLTERGLRRTARTNGSGGYGNGNGQELTWGGDALASVSPAASNGSGNGAAQVAAPNGNPALYSDGYSDELWQAPASSSASTPASAIATPDAKTTDATAATTQALRNGNGTGPYNGYGNSNGYRGAVARTQSKRAPSARELRVVSSYYNPSDWLDALRTQMGFFAASVQWWAGVDNTTVAPHSGICQARIVDGSAEGGQHGSAFFIAPNLLLTAAHVVDGQSELIIVPGKNGAGIGGANEPFGRFRVSASDMVKHPSYIASNRDFDMALIRVPAASTSTNYFDLVEELTQSRPEGVVVSGYAAWSDPQGLIDSVVNATIDADRQHMHGGFIRSLPSDDTFDYDLQSLGGTSGSPVYYIEDGDAPRTHMVGVHVASQSDSTNLGCRITPAKLAWIRQQAAAWSQSLSFSLAARQPRAFNAEIGEGIDASTSHDDVEQYSQIPEPVEDEFASEQSYRARAHALTAPTADYPGASRFAPAHARNFRTGRRRGAVIDRIVIHITAGGPNINGTIGWFQDGERINPKTGVQAGPSSAHYIIGRDGEVVQMVRNADTAYHASSANSRSIGIEHNANKPYRLNRRDLPPTQEQYQASAHLVAWLAAQYGVPLDRTHIVGHIEATPGDNHDCPSSYWDWDTYMQCVQLAAQALAQNSSTGSVPASSQALRGRIPVRTYSVDPTRFTWPAGIAADGHWAQAFAAEYNARLDDGAAGAPAPDPTQFQPVEDADARARTRTRTDIVERLGRELQSASGRSLIQRDLLALASGVAMQVLDLVADQLPATPYALLVTDAGQAPSTPPPTIVPGMLPPISRRIGMFMAWIDAGLQVANADVAQRIAAHRQEWDEMNSLVGHAGTLAGLIPGLGEAVAVVQMVVQAAMQSATPDFDRPQGDLAGAMGSIRSAYRSFAASLLRGLILARYPATLMVEFPLQPQLESLIEEHAAHALRGWQDELRFLGVGLDTMAQSLGRRHAGRLPVRAQEFITPYYDPSSPFSALTCTNDAFSLQREEWYVGVESTSAFPHSAICHLAMTRNDGRRYSGSAFYIGPNRILTCAHNLDDMASVTVTPGRNGAGSAPFGQFTVTPSSWRIAPRYSGNGDWDNDVAVIDATEIAAPGGAFFRFMHATPGGTMPLAVCGYSSGSNLHPELNPAADRNKQHLHGGHAQGQATFDTIDYDILAIAGASGSPVYTVRDEGNGLEAFVCGVHVTRGPIEASGGPSVNRGCFITPTKIDWIEGRATTFSYRGNTTRALSTEAADYPVALVPQPDKNACWAASMAMLLSFRRNASFAPETLANEVGGSLASSYSWDLLDAVRTRYGFEAVAQPSNTSQYHTPQQWSQWLNSYGPLWVVIVGAPHAVVIGGIRGNLADPASVQVKVFNPWDTRIAFDNDPVVFNPRNNGYEDWLSFEQFAADFGNMAEADYGNWRVLHLPATAAGAQNATQQNDAHASVAQSLGSRGRRLAMPPPSRGLSGGTDAIGSATADTREPIEPSRVAGTRMATLRSRAGASRWSLDQLEGQKAPAMPMATSSAASNVVIELGAWPAIEGEAAPLPLTITFHSTASGAVGDVQISAGTPAELVYGVDVVARIEDAADVGNVAALKVGIDYRFNGFAQDAPAARIELRLLGDGRYERVNRWLTTTQAA